VLARCVRRSDSSCVSGVGEGGILVVAVVVDGLGEG
jgi:hypothetical protein